MEIMYDCCCGLDVHKQLIVGCLVSVTPSGERQKETRSFTTMTAGILALADWLTAAGCAQVAMESTGVYWKPIWNLLEGRFEVLLVNAQHIKAVPGRKTDVRDAEWIADLLQHGLLRPSFVPPRPQRELRDLTRYRTTLLAERARVINRLQKVLEDTNLKLSSVATNIVGHCRSRYARGSAGGRNESTGARWLGAWQTPRETGAARAGPGRTGGSAASLRAEQPVGPH